ncbi:hypothetical protein R1sor_003698 [Riccia sorocarpa]|uniref:AAA+ ATPase domain-containing protein n=1 Tax=Riccia sorocarpa TaxID=122646 RepID=A0ABD3H6F1_9MARC
MELWSRLSSRIKRRTAGFLPEFSGFLNSSNFDIRTLEPPRKKAWTGDPSGSASSQLPKLGGDIAGIGKKLNDSLFSLYEPVNPNAELVFFHGAIQKACDDMHVRAWMSSSVCWPAVWLPDEADFPRARILSVKYDSSLDKATDAGVYSMYNLVEALAGDLIVLNDVGQTGRPVVLVGHDLGGLVIKALCVYLANQISLYIDRRERGEVPPRITRFEDFLRNVRGIFYFSTPHKGLDFVGGMTRFDGGLVPYLEIFNPDTAEMNYHFEKLRCNRKWKTAGLGPLIKDPDSSLSVAEASVRADADSLTMVSESMETINKPDSRQSSSYQTFASHVKDFVQAEVEEDSDLEFKDFMRNKVGLENVVRDLCPIAREVEGRISGLLLHGMGGIGKSTLGHALFLKLSRNFHRDYRFKFDREAVSEPHGATTELQNSLLDCLGGYRSSTFRGSGQTKLKNCYKSFKRPILLFIDNIEDEEDLEHILPGPINELLRQGSYIVVATRNSRLLSRLRVVGLVDVHLHEMKELDEASANELFCRYAFNSRVNVLDEVKARHGAWKDVRKVLSACSRLPLALKVVGAALTSEEGTSSSSRWSVDLGSPWNELWTLYGHKLDMLKRRALIKKETHIASRDNIRFPVVRVHALLVALGEKRGRDLGTHIKLDLQEDDNIADEDLSSEKVKTGNVNVLVIRGTVSFYLISPLMALALKGTQLHIRRFKSLAPFLRVLILRDMLIRGTFASKDIPRNLQCFVSSNSSVPFAGGDLSSLNKLIHVDIASTVAEHESYHFPRGLQKLRLETPRAREIVYLKFMNCCIQRFCTARIASNSEKVMEEVVVATQMPPLIEQINDSIFELYAPTSGSAEMEILFFHGLQLEGTSDPHISTWQSRSAQKAVWPGQWLPKDFPKARILSISYDGSLKRDDTCSRMDMYLVAESLLQNCLLAGVGERHPVILVGHSYGGLVIKQLFLLAHRRRSYRPEIKTFFESVKGIFYFATPHHGSHFVSAIEKLSSKEGDLLSNVKVFSKDLARLNSEYNGIPQHWLDSGLGEALPTKLGREFNDAFVEEGSAKCEGFLTVQENQFSICQPEARNSTTYQHLSNFIRFVQQKCMGKSHSYPVATVGGIQTYVPIHIQARDRIISGLENEQGPTVILLHGDHGSGKSVLARFIGESYTRSRAGAPGSVFLSNPRIGPKLVIFLQCGQTAVSTVLLQKLHEKLHPQVHMSQDQCGSGSMCTFPFLMMERRIIVVLDDVWNPELIEAFLEEVRSCDRAHVKILVTSREAHLSDDPEILKVKIGEVSDTEAENILASHLGSSQYRKICRRMSEFWWTDLGGIHWRWR